MQSLQLLEEHKSLHPAGFFERQFSPGPTRSQRRFDWAFGVVIPTVCVAADPVVFKTFDTSRPLFDEYVTGAYLLSFVSIMTMAAWLLWGDRLGFLSPFAGGLFVAGAAVSFLVGFALFPFSFMGMFLLIGFLGYTPLLSAFVYFRNGKRAIQSAESDMDADYVRRTAILAILYAIAMPLVLNYL